MLDYCFADPSAAGAAENQRDLDASTQTCLEDKAICEAVQRNLEAGAYVDGLLGPAPRGRRRRLPGPGPRRALALIEGPGAVVEQADHLAIVDGAELVVPGPDRAELELGWLHEAHDLVRLLLEERDR